MTRKYDLIILIVIILFTLNSCAEKLKKNDAEKIRVHERLLECKAKFIMDDSEDVDGYHLDYENFIKDYYSEEYKRDTLIVTTLYEVNACGNTIGDIEFSGDTLFLKIKQIAEEICASSMFETFTYRIYNPEKRKYKILTKK